MGKVSVFYEVQRFNTASRRLWKRNVGRTERAPASSSLCVGHAGHAGPAGRRALLGVAETRSGGGRGRSILPPCEKALQEL